VLLAASLAPAAEQAATLRGRVTDPLGGLVAGARVQAQGPGGRRSAVTSAAGDYVLAGLRPGTYAVTVTKDLFTPHVTDAAAAGPRPAPGPDAAPRGPPRGGAGTGGEEA